MTKAERLDLAILNSPSLPKARQWLEWCRYHVDHLPAATGWQRGLRDVLLELHHGIATSARRLRGNPGWDFQGTMTDDTESLEGRATRLLVKFETQINKKDIPERFEPLLDCLYGALRQQVRLGREIDTMRLAGRINIDVLVDQTNQSVIEQ